jgi:trehalose/maltose hydrolase-like predicted phosphorylase
LAGFYDKAYDYFSRIVDLENNNLRPCNSGEKTGKAWMCIIYGFAGMDVVNDILKFDPYLPKGWKGYCFKILFHRKRIKIKINSDGAFYELLNGGETEIVHGEQKMSLKQNETKKMRIRSI